MLHHNHVDPFNAAGTSLSRFKEQILQNGSKCRRAWPILTRPGRLLTKRMNHHARHRTVWPIHAENLQVFWSQFLYLIESGLQYQYCPILMTISYEILSDQVLALHFDRQGVVFLNTHHDKVGTLGKTQRKDFRQQTTWPLFRSSSQSLMP